jgi:hypothetical protein
MTGHSVLQYLIANKYISATCIDIPLDFLISESEKIQAKKSDLSSDMRNFICAYCYVKLSEQKKEEAAREAEQGKPAEKVILAGV